MSQDTEALTSEEIQRLGLKLFGVEILDETGVYYPESSDEIELIYKALVNELRQEISQLRKENEQLRKKQGR